MTRLREGGSIRAKTQTRIWRGKAGKADSASRRLPHRSCATGSLRCSIRCGVQANVRIPEGTLKNIIVKAVISMELLLAATVILAAQQEPKTGKGNEPSMAADRVNDANIQLMRQDIRSTRKQIIAANMQLTDSEATKFWPVYDRYIGETIKVNDVRYALIKEYAQNYQTLTDGQADSFIKRWVALDQDNTQLRLKFIPEFEKVISHKKAAMFFQLDRRISMMIELQLASQVPLVQP